MRFCPNCGAQMDDAAKFCTQCGGKMPEVMPVAPAAPVQQAPAAPVYEAPAAPVYEAPAAPVQQAPAAPVYEAPAAPVQQNYQPPVQPPVQPAVPAGSYVPPAAPPKAPKKAGGKKNGKIALFGGIAAVAIAVVVLLIVLLGGSGAKSDDPNLGLYNATSCVSEGLDLGVDDEWIELLAKGKADVRLLGDEYSGKWTLDGEDFTLKQGGSEYFGTLEDGVLVIDFDGIEYTFVKEGAEEEVKEEEPEEEPEKLEEPEAPAVAEEVGYWTLNSMEQDGQVVASEEDVAALKEMGMEMFLDLKEDGTGIMMIEEPMTVTWGDGVITPDASPDEPANYSIVDGVFTIEAEGMAMRFVRGEGEAPVVDIPAIPAEPEEPETPAEPIVEAGPYDIWEGDWYGWWIVWNGYGAYSDFTDEGWDCCAHVDVDGETGTFTMWDDTCAEGEAIIEVDVEFGVGMTEYGTMKSVSGLILDDEIEAGEWNIDQGASNMNEFEDMMVIEGTYVDPANADDCFEYIIILRPWGADWEDVRAADHSEHYYDDMMSFRYDDWYMPLVEAGFEEAPASFDEGYELIASGAKPGSGADAASAGNLPSCSGADYALSIVGAEIVPDSDDLPALRLYMDYTNKSDDVESCYMVFDFTVEQDGTELDTAITWGDYYCEYSDWFADSVLPGVTVRTATEYTLADENTPVHIVIRDWYTDEVLIELDLDPANLPGAPADEFVLEQRWNTDDFADLPWEGEYNGDFYVSIDSAEIVESAYDSEDVVRVYFTFTNNSDEATSFWMESYLIAYQNGKEIDTYGVAKDQVPEDQNDSVEVAPGETIVVSEVIEIIDNTPVYIYLKDYYGGSGLACCFELE